MFEGIEIDNEGIEIAMKYLIPPDRFLEPLRKGVISKFPRRKFDSLAKRRRLVPTLEPLNLGVTLHCICREIRQLLL